MLDKRKKKLAATPKKASNFLLLRSKKSILIALKKHCHLIGSEPHRFILHADIHSGLSVFCLIDDYLIIHTADYLLFNYNKDTKKPSEKQRNSSEKQVDSAVYCPCTLRRKRWRLARSIPSSRSISRPPGTSSRNCSRVPTNWRCWLRHRSASG